MGRYQEPTRAMLRALLPRHREILLAHIDGPQSLVAATRTDKTRVITQKLIESGLLRGDPAQAITPRASALTELGRAYVAHILAEYADALVAAGFLPADQPVARPIDVLRALKARRQPEKMIENLPHRSGLPERSSI